MIKNMYCNPVKKFIIFFTVILISNNQTISPVDISYIKDTYSILSDEFKHCSPIHGAVWAETQLLKKYYKQMKPKPEISDATIVLINELFNLNGDSFGTTNNKTKSAYHFSLQIMGPIIGSIIGSIEQNKAEADLSKEIQNIQNIINTDASFIESNKAAGNKPRSIQSAVKKLANAITNSLYECGFIKGSEIPVSYPPYTTHAILLGFLYKKSQDKNNFRTYFEQLQATITSKNIFTAKGKSLFEKADWNTGCFDKTKVDLIISTYSDESIVAPSLDQFLHKVQKALLSKGVIADPYEAVVFAEITKQFYHQSLPKVIADSSLGDTFFKSISYGFGDCTETTIRNLCNFVVYNQNENKFIPTSTETLKPSKELLDFYKGENADATKHESPKAHNDWSNLIQNIPGVIYANIISKANPDEHYETDHDILHKHGRPCYILLTQEELKKIDPNKISNPKEKETDLGSSWHEKAYSQVFIKNAKKLLIDNNEDFIIADPNEYTTYALWPSLKNIIIILNRLFGLKLYEDDPLAPFKDKNFCSKYFPILCNKLEWNFTPPKIDLDSAYFKWNGNTKIHIILIQNPNANWDIDIKKEHTEIKNVNCPAEKTSKEYRSALFKAFITCEESINFYDLLALYAPKTIDYKNMAASDRIKNYLRILTSSSDAEIDESPVKLNLQKLKSSLSDLKNKLSLLKTKMEALKLALK